jgi:hypothetical protein
MQGLPQLAGIYISQNKISSIANGAFKGKSIRNLYVSGHGRQERLFYKNDDLPARGTAFTPNGIINQHSSYLGSSNIQGSTIKAEVLKLQLTRLLPAQGSQPQRADRVA